ncbi:MAG: putative bacteriophage tail fiber protein [Burkholderiaceae bacterium]|nr:putative bacteriophage tail fiber protein [Burkholderiaceae bacterium]
MADDAVPSVLATDERFGPLATLSGRLLELDLSPLLVYLIDLVDADALPYLAEQFHVMGNEGWDFAADDTTRRALIKSSIELHRYKGTPWAIKQALTRLGLEQVSLDEKPEGAHWAEFDANITVVDRPLTESVYPQITRMIDAYKPARSHLRRLIVSAACKGVFFAGIASIAGDTVTVKPQGAA